MRAGIGAGAGWEGMVVAPNGQMRGTMGGGEESEYTCRKEKSWCCGVGG